MQDCNKCREWKAKEIYFGREGEIHRISYSRDKDVKTVTKTPLKVTVKLSRDDLDDLLEIAEKVDKLRNEYPLTDTHFVIER